MDEFLDEFAKPMPDVPDEAMAKVSALARNQVTIEHQIKQIEQLLADKKKEHAKLSEVDLPDAMATVGLHSLKLTSGHSVRVSRYIVCRLPKENAELADMWLDVHGHSGMMKNNLTVFIPKSTNKSQLAELTRIIEAHGFQSKEELSIHYQTLNKWAREMEQEGEVIPEDIFQVHRGNKTVVE